MSALLYTELESPIGTLLLVGDGESVSELSIDAGDGFVERTATLTRDDAAFGEATEQLEQYFAGERTEFDLPLAPAGTEFQRAVWDALSEIPYGETRSYGQVAAAVGRPKAARAVGMANNRNPIAVIVPCHRVIGAGGALVGYASGLERKTWLLDHEAAAARSANSSS
jgi:methylated-DNA-[protein]-cysteine S-methyltransferase